VALLLIECQACREEFRVAMSYYGLIDVIKKNASLSDRIKNGSIHDGDPPNYCCAAGPSMNSIPVCVLEFWRKDSFDFQRDTKLEIPLTPFWEKDFD
jgi:hypothetical protein